MTVFYQLQRHLFGPDFSPSFTVLSFLLIQVFHEIAYKAAKREHIIAGIDEFLDAVTVLPPGEWDPSIRIEPPDHLPSQEGRKFRQQDVCYQTTKVRRALIHLASFLSVCLRRILHLATTIYLEECRERKHVW